MATTVQWVRKVILRLSWWMATTINNQPSASLEISFGVGLVSNKEEYYILAS